GKTDFLKPLTLGEVPSLRGGEGFYLEKLCPLSRVPRQLSRRASLQISYLNDIECFTPSFMLIQ
ncbi:MAG: hypothetical protein IJ489_04675, partial [Clostridia bacterium]|nr:hypothetical protein [Clostridia bacterium]